MSAETTPSEKKARFDPSTQYDLLDFDASNQAQLSESTAIIGALWGESDFADFAYTRWQYAENPFGPVFGKLAYSRDEPPELAAQYVTVPSPLWHPGTQSVEKSLLSVNTATNANHRRKGLFVWSADATYAAAANEGFSSVFGFPNNSSLPGFLKTGFDRPDELLLHVKVLSPLLIASRTLQVLSNWRFPDLRQDEDCYRGHTAAAVDFDDERLKSCFHVPRSARWLSWRYLKHPNRKYELWGKGDAVFVSRFMQLHGIKLALLMDVLGEPSPQELRSYAKELKARGICAICAVYPSWLKEIKPELSGLFCFKVPLKLSPKAFHVIYKDLQGRALQDERFFFSLGDIDLY